MRTATSLLHAAGLAGYPEAAIVNAGVAMTGLPRELPPALDILREAGEPGLADWIAFGWDEFPPHVARLLSWATSTATPLRLPAPEDPRLWAAAALAHVGGRLSIVAPEWSLDLPDVAGDPPDWAPGPIGRVWAGLGAVASRARFTTRARDLVDETIELHGGLRTPGVDVDEVVADLPLTERRTARAAILSALDPQRVGRAAVGVEYLVYGVVGAVERIAGRF
ncbi:hypothetical protein Afil01_25430 [Actinorhabdospora filicis]|uniref:Uncharacterized protein n=1 Tax=Actinorhabdospora filicis TaxID=1785913 RepID=A0A9W6W9N6_9ACTN|nr:hypothetical protein [Actinorhabdospora filicis]GLZ77736.1 hypothetical protein Afil01_25430 [Actinorhabdospora filicis]